MKIELKPEYAAEDFFARPAINRSQFPRGPWDQEPLDKSLWRDGVTGYPCAAMRTDMGNWCGYVVLPEGHPLTGYGMMAPPLEDIEVHGGITFTEAAGPAGAWVIGFDCAHGWDVIPAHAEVYEQWVAQHPFPARQAFSPAMGVYRTLDYVREECAKLALALYGLAEMHATEYTEQVKNGEIQPGETIAQWRPGA